MPSEGLLGRSRCRKLARGARPVTPRSPTSGTCVPSVGTRCRAFPSATGTGPTGYSYSPTSKIVRGDRMAVTLFLGSEWPRGVYSPSASARVGSQKGILWSQRLSSAYPAKDVVARNLLDLEQDMERP
jgi:hypothetical protein